MKKSNNNIYKILLNSKYVNNYTKLLLILNKLDYYNQYYIPNKKLENILKINKNRVIVLLHQMEEENIIKLIYRDKKRFFMFVNKDMLFIDDINKENKKIELFDYNWLDEEDL